MSTLKISLLQQPLVWMDGEANLRHFDGVLSASGQRDLIILPETFTSGFAQQFSNLLSEERIINWLHSHAARTNALMAGSAAIQTGAGLVNRFLLVEPDGRVHYYDKRHLFRMGGEQKYFLPGKRREIIAWRGWRILPQICYDLRFPVFSRNQNDYDLALYVANWPAQRSLHWKSLLMARAIENQAYVAGCNRIGTDNNQLVYSGDSQIIDPMGEIVACTAPHKAACLNAILSLNTVNNYRESFPAWRDTDDFILKEE